MPTPLTGKSGREEVIVEYTKSICSVCTVVIGPKPTSAAAPAELTSALASGGAARSVAQPCWASSWTPNCNE